MMFIFRSASDGPTSSQPLAARSRDPLRHDHNAAVCDRTTGGSVDLPSLHVPRDLRARLGPPTPGCRVRAPVGAHPPPPPPPPLAPPPTSPPAPRHPPPAAPP